MSPPHANRSPLVFAVGALGALGLAAWAVLGQDDGRPRDRHVAVLTRDADRTAPTPPTPAPATSVAKLATEVEQPTLDDPALGWNEAGYKLLQTGELDVAIERFEAASNLWPEVDVYANNLAEALFRKARAQWEEDPAAALSTLERALLTVRDDARRAELEPLRDRWRRAHEAEDGFWTTSSPYFAVSFDGARAELMNGVDDVLRDLDAYYAEYGELFGRRPDEDGRAKIRVVFYRRATFDRVTGLGDWAGGVFDGTIRVPVESLQEERDRLRSVLRHELMHAFIQFVSDGKAPAWLNEGLAQWIERPGERRALDVALARGRLRGQTLFPLSELRGTLAAWSDKQAITRAYAQALVLVDYLAYSKGEALLFEMVVASKAIGPAGPEAHFLERFPGFPLEEFAATIPR